MGGFARAGVAALIGMLALVAPLQGHFALIGGVQRTTARMTVTRTPHGDDTLSVVEYAPHSGKPITSYVRDMTKLMHMVVVNATLSQFMHVHPVFDPKTGGFTISLPLRAGQRYFVYADTVSAQYGHQVFRFTLPSRSAPQPLPAMTPSPDWANAGPYRVHMSTTIVPAGRSSSIAIVIDRRGKLATNLRPYLGAAGHVVFINTATLAYAHIHPVLKGMKMRMAADGAMSGGGMAGPQMATTLPNLPAGTYKAWLQFRGGTHLYTVPFVVVAR